MPTPNYNGYPGQYESRINSSKRAAVNTILGRDGDKLRYEELDRSEIERKRYEEARKGKKGKEDVDWLMDALKDYIDATKKPAPSHRRLPPKDRGIGGRK